ncbi:MAG TPA: hypothetical protein PKG71_03345 [Candidatus Woesebacteria bacterium]|jgi:hypothetical protein|nr:hypothetical protein [Candidatus Woesebacteria bacterium]HNS94977.1 hypothetical protein [Candidatus Woesebacteria bacterium]
MNEINYTPIDVDSVSDFVQTPKLLDYARTHKPLVFMVSSLTVLTVLVLGIFVFSTVRERQIARGIAPRDAQTTKVNAPEVRSAEDSRTTLSPVASASATLTRPPTRTPTTTRTPTPSLIRPPTHTPTIVPPSTSTPVPEPTATYTPVPPTATFTPTYTHTPTPTDSPIIVTEPTETPTSTPTP